MWKMIACVWVVRIERYGEMPHRRGKYGVTVVVFVVVVVGARLVEVDRSAACNVGWKYIWPFS